MIGLRERFFPDTERVRRIACSVLDFGWMDRIAAEGPVLIGAEGLFMYLSGEEVEALLRALGRRFAEAVLLVEMLAPLLVGRNGMHDTVKEAAFRWSLRDSRDFERMAGSGAISTRRAAAGGICVSSAGFRGSGVT